MRVLFVCSGNGKLGISSFIRIQAESLTSNGVDIEFFSINGKGIKGYVKSGLELKKYLKDNHFDIIHAHYTLSGWAAVIGSGNTPVVLSLMGSDAYGNIIAPNKATYKSKYLTILTYLIQPFVNRIISKSQNIEKFVWQKSKSIIIPNGINIELFKPSDKNFSEELNFNSKKRYVLFLGKKESLRKNFRLVENAFKYLNFEDVELLAPYPVPHELLPKYLNSIDVLVHSSLAEGSPNLVKEAMACNRPIVATNVGDIEWLFGNEPGHFLSSFEPQDVAEKIIKALKFAESEKGTTGRKRLIELKLDSDSVAKKIIRVYQETLKVK